MILIFVSLYSVAESVPVWREESIEVTDKRVLWDLIKYRIRQVTIKYSKAKAKARRQNLKVIEDSLKQCEEDCSVFPSPENMEKNGEYSKRVRIVL